MNNSARAALLTLIFAVSSVAAAPGSGTFLVGVPTDETDPVRVKSFELLGGSSGGKWLGDDTLKVNPASYTLWNLAGKRG
ncbi:MAG: hypothetical protein HC933_17915, partial [Pleurocapsa sp. SU_196_0]|nr:hypothetical protein [Pleurocapsa sp. SU_196_0]